MTALDDWVQKHSRKEANMPKVTTKTGKPAPKSGQYRPSGTKREVTLTKGEKVPPNKGHRPKFTLVDATKHKRSP